MKLIRSFATLILVGLISINWKPIKRILSIEDAMDMIQMGAWPNKLAPSSQMLKPAMPIKIMSQIVRCLYCKKIVDIRRVVEGSIPEIINICRKCFIHTSGYGVRIWECPICAKQLGIEQVELERDGEMHYVVCPKCAAKQKEIHCPLCLAQRNVEVSI